MIQITFAQIVSDVCKQRNCPFESVMLLPTGGAFVPIKEQNAGSAVLPTKVQVYCQGDEQITALERALTLNADSWVVVLK